MTEKRRAIKEFEWFEIQTKVREIIGEALHPLQKRVLSNSGAIFKLQERGKEETIKIQYLTEMVNKDPKIFEHGIFGVIEDKIRASNLHIQELQNKIGFFQSFINNKISVLDQQLKESGQSLNAVNDFRQYIKGQVDSQNTKLIQSMHNLFANFDQINQEITQLSRRIDRTSLNNEQLSLKVDQACNQLREGTSHIDEVLSGFSSILKEIELRGQMRGNDIQLLKQQIKRLQHFQKLARGLEEHISILSNQINNFEYKLQVIHPMGVLAQINQYAHHVLPTQLHNNISIYFYNRYRHLAQAIIENEVDRRRVGYSRKENLDLIKETHQKATKRVFQLKKEHLALQGINIDELSHDKRQQLLQKLELKEEVEVFNLSDQSSDRKKSKEEAESALMSEVVQKSQQLMLGELKQRIQVELKDAKQYMLSMEQVMKKDLQKMQKTILSCQSICGQLEMENQLQSKFYKELEASTKNNLAKNSADIRRLQLGVKTILHALTIFHQIELQDETDRQNIALLGVRQRHRDPVKEYNDYITKKEAPLQITKQCLSCSGNSNYYNQFFKMACLTYSSTPIKHNNRLYERQELLTSIHQKLQEVTMSLSGKQLQYGKSTGEEGASKMSRYESSQIVPVPPRDTHSASDSFTIRNISASQEALRSKQSQKPRILSSQELAESLMVMNRRRVCGRRKQVGYRQLKARKDFQSQERTDYMMKVSGFFKDLKKQNQAYIK